jgi:signal transduction histidine kinase/ligand-binding sensor domain-containing protein
VRAIAQDRDGTLWFGTDNGLARYDGRRTEKVLAEGLPSGRVNALFVDKENTLWVGTEFGATRLDEGRFDAVGETAGHSITAITGLGGGVVLASEQGRLFTCTVAYGGRMNVTSIGPAESSLLATDGGPVAITSLIENGRGMLAGTQGRGLLALNGASVREQPSRSFFISAIKLMPDGRLIYGSDRSSQSGLYELREPDQAQRVAGVSGAVTSLCLDDRSNLWVGTATNGLFLVKASREIERVTFENSAGGLRSNNVYGVFIDREGVIWVGTDRGVCRYDPRSPRGERLSESKESNFVRAVFRSRDGRMLCGTNRGLFVKAAAGAGDWREVDELTGKTVYCIAQDKKGGLLIGSAGGLYAGEPLTRIVYSIELPDAPDSIRSICVFKGTTYVASFGRGVERLEEDNRTLVWSGDPSDSKQRDIVSLYNDRDERMWIGTASGGVFYFDGKDILPEPGLDSLRGAAIWGINGSGSERLWLATERGLYAHRSGVLTAVIEGSDIRSVAAGRTPGEAWCGAAGNGLFKISLDYDSRPTVARLDTEHGLPSDNVFAVLSTYDGDDETVWIGTNRGVASYMPGRIAPLLRMVRVLGKRPYQPEEWAAGLKLEYPQNSLLFEVAAISSRTFPEQFQYTFEVRDGSNRVVKHAVTRESQVVVEGLQPGHYVFEMRAYTNDLVESDPLRVGLEVAGAPFPRVTAALSVLLALSLLALWWGYYQNRKLARTNLALKETRMQLAKETENERRRIARDLHDQTLADLRRLLMLTDKLPAEKANGESLEPAAFRSEIESISTEIRRICEDLSPSVLSNVGLTAALEWALSDAVAHLPADQKFEHRFVSDDSIDDRISLDAVTQIQVYRIVQEAISNVCNHSGARNVCLTAEVTEKGELVVTLEDDGRGFEPPSRKAGRGRGLNNMRSRASLIDAEIAWSPREGGGTVFTLRKRIEEVGG